MVDLENEGLHSSYFLGAGQSLREPGEWCHGAISGGLGSMVTTCVANNSSCQGIIPELPNQSAI